MTTHEQSFAQRVYRHRFSDGPGGWLGWENNAAGAQRLLIEDGAAVSNGPWWIDYNHAPPGGGYLHLLFALHTFQDEHFPQQYKDLGGENSFVKGKFPLNFTGARITVEMRGSLSLRGAQVALLAQAKMGDRWQNHILASQPISIRSDWAKQLLHLVPDDSQWISLGSRHDRTDRYANGRVSDVLANLNGDIILVLFPLNVKPLNPLSADHHHLRAGEDYPVDTNLLPSGQVSMREVEISFA